MKKLIGIKTVLILTVFCAIFFACSKAVSPTHSSILPATTIKPDPMLPATIIKTDNMLPATIIKPDSAHSMPEN